MSLIQVNNLHKKFSYNQRAESLLDAFKNLFKKTKRSITALDDVSFTVNHKEIVGYIGPNGAGKSTTIKILSGILIPDAGDVRVLGNIPWKHRKETVQNIGVVFGQRTQLWWDLPVIESFELLKEIYQIPHSQYNRSKDELIEKLSLQKLIDMPARQLSLGQRMRCDIAAALLHEPKLLFLDEPTIGLDAVSKLAVRDFIQSINKDRNVSILLTTHDMDDIELLCSRIIILNEGKVYLDGTLNSLREMTTTKRRIIIDLENQDTITSNFAQVISQEGHRVYLEFNPQEVLAKDVISELMAHHSICDITIEDPPIEQIIAQLYKNVNL